MRVSLPPFARAGSDMLFIYANFFFQIDSQVESKNVYKITLGARQSPSLSQGPGPIMLFLFIIIIDVTPIPNHRLLNLMIMSEFFNRFTS